MPEPRPDFLLGQRITWTDSTSYQQGGSRVQTCWSTKIVGVRLTLVHGNRDYRDKWLLTCHDFSAERDPQDWPFDDVAGAKDKAIRWLWSKSQAIMLACEKS